MKAGKHFWGKSLFQRKFNFTGIKLKTIKNRDMVTKKDNIMKLLHDYKINKKLKKSDIYNQIKKLEYWKNIINSSPINFDIKEKLYKKNPFSNLLLKFLLLLRGNFS